MLDFDLHNHRPLRELVYEELKQLIVKGKILPGTRMMEVDLAQELGVSRTPVREAIRKLEKEGLVTIEPRRGAYASEISIDDIVDVLIVRENLEALASYLTAEKIKPEDIDELNKITSYYTKAVKESNTEDMIHYDEMFHRRIVELSGNTILMKLSEIIADLALRFRYLYYDDFERYENMPNEHKDIIQVLATGEKEKARDVANMHVKKLKEFVMEGNLYDK